MLLCVLHATDTAVFAKSSQKLFTRTPNDGNNSPIEKSSDVWAAVIANVAPWMALVGDRNAKEFLRISASQGHLLLMATAPLGIFSILTSAIRLSGHPLLRRIVGRESERRSEALTELTPLSVSPATSAYNFHGVEIEPNVQKDRVAYISAHTKQVCDSRKVLLAFRKLLSSHEIQVDDKDFEIVLAMKGNMMSLEGLMKQIETLVDEALPISRRVNEDIASASLSFRINGISPNQTAPDGTANLGFSLIFDVTVSVLLFMLTCGLHIAGYFLSRSSAISNVRLQTFTMGIVGYVGITIFTYSLLNLIKSETDIKPLSLPDIFKSATWTFSDSRHSGHRAFDLPPGRSLVHAIPKTFEHGQQPKRQARRQMMTLVLCLGLVLSFVVFYLGVRVAQWWVALGSLTIIWLSAGLRSLVIRSFLMANDKPLGEHWLGIFEDNIYNSLLATVDAMQVVARQARDLPCRSNWHGTTRLSVDLEKPRILVDAPSHSMLVVKPIRQSIKSWSGCEDVMKVSLAMSKHHCRMNIFSTEGLELRLSRLPHLRRIVRFRLMIYIPGLVWQSRTCLDYVLTREFDFPNLYRDLLKIIHLCGDMDGQITRHDLCAETQTQLSHVLCGPVKLPDPDLTGDMDLCTLLGKLRNANQRTEKAYLLEQIVLLPTIQLATMYESFPTSTTKSRIQTLQNAHNDQLSLSGAAYLHVLEKSFLDLQIWNSFMKAKTKDTHEQCELKPRDNTSGLYGRHVNGSSTLDYSTEQDNNDKFSGASHNRNRLEPLDSHLYFEQHKPSVHPRVHNPGEA